jgi:hypothetical protein
VFGAEPGSAPGGFGVSPTGETVVADPRGNRVVRYNPDGSTAAAFGSPGSGPGQFKSPASAALDGQGDVYVADTGNDRIQVLSPDGEVIRTWGSRGGGDGRFRGPYGIAVDSAGDVYVSDRSNHRIEKFSPTGKFLAKWGARGAGVGELSAPAGLTVDCRGGLVVADSQNNRLERFAGVSPAVGCAPFASFAAPPPPPLPAPVLRVTLRSRTGVLARRGLVVVVGCDRPCQITARARLNPAVGRARTGLSAAPRRLGTGTPTPVRLSLGAHGVRLMQAALGKRRRGLRALVTVTAISVGNAPGTPARPFQANYHVSR